MIDFHNISEDSEAEPESKEKFHGDKFYMKDMHLPEISYKEAMSLLADLGDNFKQNSIENIAIPSIPYVQESIIGNLPLTFTTDMYEVVEISEKEIKKQKKNNLRLFMHCIRQYLDGLYPDQLADQKWSKPDYKSDYNIRTRRLTKPEGLKTSFQIK